MIPGSVADPDPDDLKLFGHTDSEKKQPYPNSGSLNTVQNQQKLVLRFSVMISIFVILFNIIILQF